MLTHLIPHAVEYRVGSPPLAVPMQCIETLDKSRTIYGSRKTFNGMSRWQSSIIRIQENALARQKINNEDSLYPKVLIFDNYYFLFINFVLAK